MSRVAESLAAIRGSLQAFPDIDLVGVAKGQTAHQVREAVAAGLKHVANNYVQEGDALRTALGAGDVNWHYIGHIQSRKAKQLTSYDCVQSLDRLTVAAALQAALKAEDRKISALIQINVGGEAQKSGIPPEELERFLEATTPLTQLDIRGLMVLPPLTETPEARRPYFKTMRRLFDQHAKALRWNCLSMGMSDDYLIAAQEGSTMVRVGTLLFGARQSPKE